MKDYANKMYIIEELLPNNRADLVEFIQDYTKMVCTKLIMLEGYDPYEDRELIQMQAMLLCIQIANSMVDFCCDPIVKEVKKK